MPGMRVTWIGVLAAVLLVAVAGRAAITNPIEVWNGRGAPVPLEPEKLQGLKTRPLAKLKETMDGRFGEGFLALYRIKATDGTELLGRCRVTTAPVRLTVYEISRRKQDRARYLRVVASGYYDRPGQVAEFRTTVQDLQEELYFVTAERVQSADELDSHLRYMNTQDNAILVKGFSTNWNLTALKVNLAGRNASREEVPFTKDAEWLVDHLIRPLWVAEIRIDPKP